MKKLIGFAFKLVAAPLFIGGLLVMAIGACIVHGPEKTGQKLAKLAKAMDELNK